MKANKIYFFNVIKESLNAMKNGKKNQLKNALGFLDKEDVEEVVKVLKMFKLSY